MASGASELLARVPLSFFQPLDQPQAVLFGIDCLELCLLLHSFNLAFSLFQSAVGLTQRRSQSAFFLLLVGAILILLNRKHS